MEEIKFRWVGLNRKFNEIMINEELTINKIKDGKVLSFFSRSNRGKDGNCKFLSEDLFTGLKDKNGKEIYEGDIIEYTQHRAYNLGGFKAKVVYDNERACFGYIKEKPFITNYINPFTETDELKHDLLSYLEIIGNIYENSDLLS